MTDPEGYLISYPPEKVIEFLQSYNEFEGYDFVLWGTRPLFFKGTEKVG